MFDKLKSFIGRVFSDAGLPNTAHAIVPSASGGLLGNAAYWYGGGGDGSGWPHGLASGATLTLDHARLRQNARIAYHDSMPARAIVERFADIVPGIGLKFEANPQYTMLGMTPEAADQWGQQVSEAFDAYMSSKTFSLLEDETGYQSQRLVSIMQQRDGEYFVRHSYSRDPKLLNPLQVSFVDPSQIQGSYHTPTNGEQFGTSGIVYDSAGREMAYRISVFNYKTNQTEIITVPAKGARSGRRLMGHGYQKEYPGQVRGYSRLAHALQSFDKFGSFEHAHICKAINDAAITFSVKPSDNAPASNFLEDFVAGPAGPLTAGATPGDTTETNTTDVVNYSEMNTVNLRPDSIGVFNLQAGEELAPFKGSTPADNYAEFTNAFVKSLSASMSMPIEVLWMQFGNSYSASRATLVMLWQVVEIWRREMIADYLEPILENWLAGEIAAGRVSAPGWSDPRMRRAWLAGQWIGFPMPNIDPLKAAKAQKENLSMGATTLDRVAHQNDGSSGKANRAKLTRELTELPETPFTKSAAAPGAAPGGENFQK